jgi:hypothetical protein
MQANAGNNNGPHESGSSLPTALQLVTALTEEQKQQLRDFAGKRMRRIAGTPGMDRFLAGARPDDFVNAALEKALLGDTCPKKGRRLSVKNRQSTEAFVSCLMGIVNSDLSNAVNGAEASFSHLPWGNAETEPGTVEAPEPVDPGRLLEERDQQRELFARLRKQAGPELQPIIDGWEPNYLSSNGIAHREFDRRLVHRVRLLAREIITDLAREIQPQDPNGMEPLM